MFKKRNKSSKKRKAETQKDIISTKRQKVNDHTGFTDDEEDIVIKKKTAEPTKKIKGLDLDKVHAEKIAKSLNENKFAEVTNFHLTNEKPPEEPKNKTNVPDKIKDLFKLPEELNYANYNENRDVIDKKHWLAGLAEIDVDKEKDESMNPTVNVVAKALNKEAVADLVQQKEDNTLRFDRVKMDEFDESQFKYLTGAYGRHNRKKAKKD
ncbi:unnamed protein product [Moneuplotes crassus]|uniref:Uncharacterized protein n=1 Tax=Euplotes crassus TaxID=5936 RepID=A0AAD1XW14_EUPCR|nr:unnamed protein product [Moneuplotes crassus]